MLGVTRTILLVVYSVLYTYSVPDFKDYGLTSESSKDLEREDYTRLLV